MGHTSHETSTVEFNPGDKFRSVVVFLKLEESISDNKESSV